MRILGLISLGRLVDLDDHLYATMIASEVTVGPSLLTLR